MATNSILGQTRLDLGPANIYIKPVLEGTVETDWNDVSDWVDLGYTESSTFKTMITKTDLTASQVGTRPADKVVTGSQAQIETSLGQSYLERLENVMQGLELTRNTAGDITQAKFVSRLGQRDSSVLFWVKFVRFNDGAESVNPLEIVYMKAAPASDSIDLTFDASTQRFFGVMLEAYANNEGTYSVSGANGEDCYYWTGEVI